MGQLHAELKEIVSLVTKIPVEQIQTDDDLFEKYGIDSMQRVEILIEVEKRFQISVPDEEAQTLRKFPDFIKAIHRHKAVVE